jgi:hypothetical protein
MNYNLKIHLKNHELINASDPSQSCMIGINDEEEEDEMLELGEASDPTQSCLIGINDEEEEDEMLDLGEEDVYDQAQLDELEEDIMDDELDADENEEEEEEIETFYIQNQSQANSSAGGTFIQNVSNSVQIMNDGSFRHHHMQHPSSMVTPSSHHHQQSFGSFYVESSESKSVTNRPILKLFKTNASTVHNFMNLDQHTSSVNSSLSSSSSAEQVNEPIAGYQFKFEH